MELLALVFHKEIRSLIPCPVANLTRMEHDMSNDIFSGKLYSILGDSISTYRGISNDKEANVTIEYNPYFYSQPFPEEKTYWRLLENTLGMRLCVNNSWSGGNLSGEDDPSSGMNRSKNLADNRGTVPSFIIVFMGINDLGRNVAEDIFERDYKRTLEIIKESYPEAVTCCVNLPDRHPDFKDRTERFNSIIKSASEDFGERSFIADLFSSKLKNDVYYMNTVDGLHPDEDGARIIYEVILDAFLSFAKRRADIRSK